MYLPSSGRAGFHAGLAKPDPGVPVVEKTLFGLPAEAILNMAEEEEVDLIAMTTHGRSGVSRWLFGSVAEQVLRNADCPLLVMRTGNEE